jgi:hypothetical protein
VDAKRFEIVLAGSGEGSFATLHHGQSHAVGRRHDEQIVGLVDLVDRIRGKNSRKFSGIKMADIHEGIA